MLKYRNIQGVSDIIDLFRDRCDRYPVIDVCKTSLIFFFQTCLTTYYGLWKGCTKTLWVADINPERESCGPAELPGGDFKIYCLVGWVVV